MSHNCTCRTQLTQDRLAEVDKIIEPYRGQPG